MVARLYSDSDQCSVDLCERVPESRGLCHSHFEYLRRTGTWPTHRLYSDIPWEERFWARTTPGENGCILWTGATGGDGRYGMTMWQGRNVPAHKVAYLAFRGDYDQSLDLDHLCRTTLCVNPLHLEPVTHRENVLRGESLQAQNARKTECVRGHDLTDPANVARRGGGRVCITCRRERNAETWQRRRAELEARHEAGECSQDLRCKFCAPNLDPHGRVSTYRKGCRCAKCCAGLTAYNQRYRRAS